jgi:hypothetical protein
MDGLAGRLQKSQTMHGGVPQYPGFEIGDEPTFLPKNETVTFGGATALKINRELLDSDVYNLWAHWVYHTAAGRYNSMEPAGLTNRQLARFTRWWTTVRGWDPAHIPDGLFLMPPTNPLKIVDRYYYDAREKVDALWKEDSRLRATAGATVVAQEVRLKNNREPE